MFTADGGVLRKCLLSRELRRASLRRTRKAIDDDLGTHPQVLEEGQICVRESAIATRTRLSAIAQVRIVEDVFRQSGFGASRFVLDVRVFVLEALIAAAATIKVIGRRRKVLVIIDVKAVIKTVFVVLLFVIVIGVGLVVAVERSAKKADLK